jgi:hypothetical protein
MREFPAGGRGCSSGKPPAWPRRASAAGFNFVRLLRSGTHVSIRFSQQYVNNPHAANPIWPARRDQEFAFRIHRADTCLIHHIWCSSTRPLLNVVSLSIQIVLRNDEDKA